MRLKSINIEERSSIYSSEQKDRLRVISSEVNKIGEIFDVLVDLESFVIENIEQKLNDFMNVKTNKGSIVAKIGIDKYLSDYFRPASDSLDADLNRVVDLWNEKMVEINKKEYTLKNIKSVINKFKELYKFIDPIIQTSEFKIEGFESLKKIIEEFTNFKIYRVLISEDIVEKLQSLIDLKSKIEGKKEKKKLTIDDL